jgi:excisionase family DNA binding protein
MTTEQSSPSAKQDGAPGYTGMTRRLLKGEDVAGILQVSKSFAYQLIRCGDIPSIRLGRAVRVRPEDLQRFIESNVCGSNRTQFMGGTN